MSCGGDSVCDGNRMNGGRGVDACGIGGSPGIGVLVDPLGVPSVGAMWHGAQGIMHGAGMAEGAPAGSVDRAAKSGTA